MRSCALLLASLIACSPGGGTPRRDSDSGTTPDTGTMTMDGGSTRPDFGRADFGMGECSATTATAESAIAPVDIVWVIDNSGSMSEEARIVQENINGFSSAISSVGLDVHVVVITSESFVTVPPPLGTDTSRFLRVNQDVQSSNSLERLLDTLPEYEPFLRRNAVLHFIAVTDDESRLPWSDFQTSMQMQLGRAFRFHAIASPPGSTHVFGPFGMMDGCEGPNGDAADNGDEYWALSMATGGRQLSICTADWSALFNDLTRAISVPQSLPCSYQIPAPPAGETFDPGFVNVQYTPGGGGPVQTIPSVGSIDRCSGDGWYYSGGTEEMPARVELCPNACSRIEGDAAGRIDIAFGCETLLI